MGPEQAAQRHKRPRFSPGFINFTWDEISLKRAAAVWELTKSGPKPETSAK